MKLTRYILTLFNIQSLFSALNTSYSPPSQSIFNKSISLISLSSINVLNLILSANVGALPVWYPLDSYIPLKIALPSTLEIPLLIQVTLLFDLKFKLNVLYRFFCGSKQ
jgi:hypothetical protein